MWKDIQGWEDLYEVSDSGDIRNKETGALLVGDVNNAGYHRVCLYKKGHNPPKQRMFRHRLVATHFIPNPNNLPEVNHIDLDKANNSARNLEWVTRGENEHHGRVNGARPYRPFMVKYNDGRSRVYETSSQLASEFGITRAAVKHWLHYDKGYRGRGIRSIQYI